MRLRGYVMVGLALLPVVAAAQTPAGGEFQVSAYWTGNQAYPSAAMDARGNFVVTWEDASADGSSVGVFARLYDAAGVARGPAFVVPARTAGSQGFPAVAMDRRGGFIVVWDSEDADWRGVFGQRFAANGGRVGGEFQVNTYTTAGQYFTAVSVDRRRNFVVAWSSRGQDGSGFGVYAQRFDAHGARVGGEFRVNSYTSGDQMLPSVSHDAAGNFTIVWSSEGQDGDSQGAFGQRYLADGSPAGFEFRANTTTFSSQDRASVSMAPEGRFTMSWMSPDGHGQGIAARRFDAAGSAEGLEFRANVATLNQQFFPSIAGDDSGNFVVAWAGYTPGFDQFDLMASRFEASGIRRGTEFRVNTFTAGDQYVNRYAPTLASDPVGNLVVVWTSNIQDGSGYGVYAQRFGGLIPGAMVVDGGGNGVWEPGEAVDVRPAWRNLNGAAQTFSGVLSGPHGPPGTTTTILDATGSYGTAPNGALQACADCYRMSVSAPPSRPSVHWDASVAEALLPDSLGQRLRWLLHIGGSFSDVPQSSAYYRFVETLLHHGVTGGCTATDYCPGVVTTRAQMAVFVLAAREGATYAPPPCGAPMFADVPASSPFCSWIEELARRGVVAGCGGGNYCPDGIVNREQMAVFTLRTLDAAIDPPACGTPMFLDVPASSPYCRWIEELARRNVVAGCGGGNYCPQEAVTREQMAVFIAATFGLSLYGP